MSSTPQGTPRVSVVLPTYNHRHFLPRAIGSLLAQSYRDFELIVVNDGSSDGTREFLDGLTDPRLVIVHQENGRLPKALNAGFARARGELFTWVSADNYCAPMFLAALVAALDGEPDAGFAYSAFAWIDAQDRITGIHRGQEVTYRSLLKQNPGLASFLYRRRCAEAVGQYDPALDGAEDWDMWLRIAERFPSVYVPEVLYYYRLHDDSMTVRVRDRVMQASRQVVINALDRRDHQLDMHELYPALPACRDRETAEFYACLDFGTSLLQSPFAPVELAIPFLEQACSMRPDPVAQAHLALASGRAGRWPEVQRLLPGLRAASHPALRQFAETMQALAQQQQRDGFLRLPAFALDRTGVELFEREAARARVVSFSLPGGEPSSEVPTLPLAVLPAASEPSRPQTTSPPERRTPVAPPYTKAPPAAATPLVSVIVPTHNRPATLRVALESILAQTLQDFEIVVVNDAGDDVAALVTSLDPHGRISYVRHGVNRGLAAARNSGLGVARGKYVAYLDDDDRFYPEHLTTLVTALEQGPHRVAYTDALRVMQVKQGDDYTVVGRDLPYSLDFDRDQLLVHNCFPVLCVMHARDCLDAVGGFDESMTTHEDWELWVRLSARFPFAHLKTITCEFSHRVDGSSMTSSLRPDYLRTAEIIYARTEPEVAGKPQVAAARASFIGGLRASVQAPAAQAPPVSSSTSSGRFDCSIVIPVWNRADLTEQCLVKLGEVTDGVTFEVIIVDNGSTDRTPELLAQLSGDVQVIRNVENRGFAAACNQGARAARGRYVVFLNNDTLPLAGWLTPLVEELDRHPEVSVAGSKLLFADGTVQHAGVVFTREVPLGYHVFYRDDPAQPRVNRRRELNCVTGACMIVRPEVFRSLGGFDEGYRNGFEDVDFCVQVRQQGGKIVYQPRSVLYHLESQTPGRKTHDEANWQRFFARWGDLWWALGDEDAVLVPEGVAVRTIPQPGGGEARVTTPIDDPAERGRWELVARAQQSLRDGDADGLARALARRDEWPADPSVQRWADALLRRFDRGHASGPAARS